MPLQALIFDVDGTLADTERDGHRPACNTAFAQLGYPVEWSWDEYKRLLPIQGNAARMRLALEKLTPPLAPAELEDAVERLITLKKQLYVEEYAPRLPLRPGVRELVEQALARGVRLAIVTTSFEEQVHALLRYQMPDAAASFAPLLGKRAGVKTAPDSPLYRRALAELGLPARSVLAIEDSEVGCQAAVRAGVPCAVFYNDYTFGENFAGVLLVARSLAFFGLDQLEELCVRED